MTKRIAGGLLATLGVLSTPALVWAADLPLRTAPPAFTAPILINNWDGFYVGSTFGYGFTSFKTRQTGTRTIDASGFSGGALVGYNAQFGHFVFGPEGSIDINDAKETDNGGTGVARSRVESLYDIRLRGRLGYEFGWFMPFVAGGAVINESYQSRVLPTDAFGDNQQKVGYTVGAGVDVKLNPARLLGVNNSFISTFLGPLILRLEYIHDGVPSSTYSYAGTSFKTKSDTNLVRAALISRFGENPPRPYIDPVGNVNWAGAYGGVFGGGGFLTAKTKGPGGGGNKLDSSGAFGGIYAGTNFMVYNRVMLGFEGSTSYADITGNGATPTGRASFRDYVMADLRGRAGYAFGNFLPFAAAGVAYGRSEQVALATGSQNGRVKSTDFTIGGGIDYRVSERVSLRGEYLYLTPISDKTVDINNCFTCKQKLDGNLFRFGAAYHFE